MEAPQNLHQEEIPSMGCNTLWIGPLSLVLQFLLEVQNQRRKKLIRLKCFTQDGQLVEIDKNFSPPQAKKITNEELQRWVNK